MANERKAAKDPSLPRELLVMRHGKSDWEQAKKDFDRPLARRGRKDAPRVGARLKRLKLVPDLVVSSPARRARETVERLLPELGVGEGEVKWEPRLYESTMETHLRVLEELPASARRVLVVGHNPSLEDLVLHLGGDAVRIPDDGKLLPTAAVAHLRMPPDWGRLHPGAGELAAILRPKDPDA